MKKFFVVLPILFLLLILFANLAFSQDQTRDVVYLKNGSVIKGEIIEQIPNESIKIQTSDGNIFIYNFLDIEKMTKDTVETQSTGKIGMTSSSETEEWKGGFVLSGGIAFPVGSFGGTSDLNTDGYAKIGYSFSAEYDLPVNKILFGLASLTFSSNSFDNKSFTQAQQSQGMPSSATLNTGSWYSLTPMVGLGAQSQFSPALVGYVSVQLGLMVGWFPSMSASYEGQTIDIADVTSGTGFAWGASAGIQINKKFIVSLKLIASTSCSFNVNSDISGTASMANLILHVGVLF